MAVKLNEGTVGALPVPKRGHKIHYFAEAVVQGAKVPAGFGVRVTAHGSRSFVLRYRDRKTHREYMLTLGPWGALNVTAAVRLARSERETIASGGNPLEEGRAARKAATAAQKDTLQAICQEYLDREGKNLRSLDWRKKVLARLVYRELGKRQIENIRRSEIVRLLDKIADESGPVMADRTLAIIRKIMNWHASRSDEFRSPIVRGMARTKPKERARSRILSDDELRAVWKAAEKAGPFGALVRFILLTSARRAEVSEMAWDELDGSDWTLPASRNKTKVDLLRPLSKEALALLPAEPTGKFVFSTDDGKTPISGFSKFKRSFDKASGVTGWTLHDLRRSARSLMSRAGVSTDHAERCLGHTMSGVRGTYDRYEYHREKQQAYEALAALIERIVNPPADNVRPIRRTATRS
jgi:integrase